ncbi:MAG: type II toxin-antitoxin system VapB family antitoxin [Trueperaceae bacterium]|nr:type II toxin-antitoxin system VapB family antitoxin [Trueperaceae bacterium]
MALNIKDAATHRRARELAERRGTTMTQAVADALAEALARTSTPPASPKLSRLEEISRRAAKLPVLDTRTPDEIVGYDAQGLPG